MIEVRLSEREQAALDALRESLTINAEEYASRHEMTTHEARVVFYRLCGIGLAKRVPDLKNTFAARRPPRT